MCNMHTPLDFIKEEFDKDKSKKIKIDPEKIREQVKVFDFLDPLNIFNEEEENYIAIKQDGFSSKPEWLIEAVEKGEIVPHNFGEIYPYCEVNDNGIKKKAALGYVIYKHEKGYMVNPISQYYLIWLSTVQELLRIADEESGNE